MQAKPNYYHTCKNLETWARAIPGLSQFPPGQNQDHDLQPPHEPSKTWNQEYQNLNLVDREASSKPWDETGPQNPVSTTRAAFRNPGEIELGHGDDQLVQRRRVELPKEVHHPNLSQQPRSVQDLHHGSDVGELLHGVPLNRLLRPPRRDQTGRPGTAGLFFVQLEELRLGRRGPLSS